MTNVFITNLALPFTGVFISLLVYLIGMWLFKISNGFFLFTPLLVGMVLGIVILAIWAKVANSTTAIVYKKFYQPGGNLIFWFLNPATMAFAIPLYRVDPAVTAMACILNAVINYALAEFLIKVFRLKKISKVGTGLGLGSAGHTVGSAKAVQLGSIQGAMAAVAVVIVSLAMDILVPIYAHLFM